MRTALRLLPLPFSIALCLPAMADDEKPESWALCPIQDVIPAFDGAAPPAASATPQVTREQRAEQPTSIEGDSLGGTETNLEYQGNVALKLSPADRLGVAYARSEGRYDRNQDGAVDTDLEGINISPDRATAFWEQDWGHGVATRLQASHALDREFERFGSVVARFEGYTTVDLQAAIALPVGRLSVGVENLLGKQYISYYSQTTPSADDYVAGRGRVLSLAWSHRF